uniref:NADH-ubiquinone oxidoreductase chain 5 n=1 Tax=Araneus ventricosus TaxID=182803 RepID=A0A0U1XJ71_ARAVE|nr:NADH dehydrogenase subunit 5 [Araneus ventricosus]AIU45753.1 NADH dehydrogenase subunit 5 [Araneus ventricosus]
MFQSMLMIMFSIPPLLLAFYMLHFSMFISLELPLLSMFSINIPVSILIDWTSMMFLFTVMFISSMILMFSMEYIPPSEHKQFSLMLLSFVMSMAILILSDNIIFMLLGWDGLGLTSFILVVYYQNASSSASGSITIFSNRVGDILILLSIAFLASICNWNFTMNENIPNLVMLFLVMAACSKSAQFPFSAWLPAAMAAPTPISALVHSSTLVTAGVYLLIRVMNYPHPTSMTLILIISSMTALYASMSANWEMDMKKIIALSTLSQIAMMMFAISLGSMTLAFFHLIIHAMFKSMMFLCAGIMIHSSSYQDMRPMGTTLNNTPIVASILGISSLSLMGVPFMSGFFSKDPIVETVIFSKTFSLMSFLMILSVGMTSAYSIRMISYALKFNLKSKSDINIHQSFMEIPIIIMAPLSIFMGTLMMWISSPEQILMIPNFFKFSIIMISLMGLMLGITMTFSSNLYLKMGQAAISLWFNHFLTILPSLKLSKLMNFFLKNDKTWQETYGPNYCYYYSSLSSSYPDKLSSQLLFIILMMMLYPPLILSY